MKANPVNISAFSTESPLAVMTMSKRFLSLGIALALLAALAGKAMADQVNVGVTNYAYNVWVTIYDPDSGQVLARKEITGRQPGEVYHHEWIAVNARPVALRVIVQDHKGGDLVLQPHYDAQQGYYWYGVEIQQDSSVNGQ